VKRAIVYVVYGHWLTPMCDTLLRHALRPALVRALRVRDVCVSVAYRLKLVLDYFIYGQFVKDVFTLTLRQTLRLGSFLKREVLVPVWAETRVQSVNVARWTRDVGF
jgi:hypothetical protein